MDILQPEMSSSSSSFSPTASAETTDAATALYLKFKITPEKNQLQTLQELANAGESGRIALMQFLLEHRPSLLEIATPPAPSSMMAKIVAGKAYAILRQSTDPQPQDFLRQYFPTGVIPLKSDVGVDYSRLQELLAQQEFQQADKLNNEKLCELAGDVAMQRKWVYFTDVDRFPITDLHTINALWLVHSEGKFGYSVQREIWLGSGKIWEKLWTKLDWKNGNTWTRYPQEFTWDLSAPRGHLPLSNQLRGVRVIAALLAHPAWTKL